MESRVGLCEETEESAELPIVYRIARAQLGLIFQSCPGVRACEDLMQIHWDFDKPGFELSPMYLAWMCAQVIYGDFDNDKANRWVGYISAGLIANRLSSLKEQRDIVRRIKEGDSNDT